MKRSVFGVSVYRRIERRNVITPSAPNSKRSTATLDGLVFFLWAIGMTNIGGLIAPERILGDIRTMITDPLEGVDGDAILSSIVGLDALTETTSLSELIGFRIGAGS